MNLSPELEETLAMLGDLTADASEPWWIIGSAAVALHGACLDDIRDVDLMMGLADARNILERLRIPSAPDTGHPQFRSAVFGTWRAPPLPVEIFAGFSLAGPKGWSPLMLESRQAVRVAGHTLYVPTIGELYGLLLAFGRPKDLERARLLGEVSAPATAPGRGQPHDPNRSSS